MESDWFTVCFHIGSQGNSQLTFTCSKSKIKALEKDLKYVQS